MKKITIFAILLVSLFIASCSSTDIKGYDGLILTDTNTGQRYLIKHYPPLNYCGEFTYTIKKEIQVINGKDTTYQFK